MKPLFQIVVTVCLVLAIEAHPENIEEVKELPQTKEPVVEAEESDPQARIERCTACSPNLEQLPGEGYKQKYIEICSPEKGCTGRLEDSASKSSVLKQSYTSSANGGINLSGNPFLNGDFGRFNAANSGQGSGYRGSTPTPFTASSVGSSFFENDYQGSSSGSQQPCTREGYICVPRSQCINGEVNINGVSSQKQYCNLQNEVCCRIVTLGSGSFQGSYNSFPNQGSNIFLSASEQSLSSQGSSSFGTQGNFGFGSNSVGSSASTNRGPSFNDFTNAVSKSTGQSNFIETDSFVAANENNAVYGPGQPYLPPVSSTSFASPTTPVTYITPTFTPRPVTIRPFTTPKPTYAPPVSSTSGPGYLPPYPAGEASNPKEIRVSTPAPTYRDGNLILDVTRQPDRSTVRPVSPSVIPRDIPVGCAAALKCTAIEYCTAEGVISTSPVALTRDQEAYRVPLTDCKDLETGIIGKCCRDPNYTDPWPTNQLGKWVPDVFGGNDGRYVPDNRGSPSTNVRPQVTVRLTDRPGSLIENQFRIPTTPTFRPNQITPGYPSSTVTPLVQKNQFGFGGQTATLNQGTQGQFVKGTQSTQFQGQGFKQTTEQGVNQGVGTGFLQNKGIGQVNELGQSGSQGFRQETVSQFETEPYSQGTVGQGQQIGLTQLSSGTRVQQGVGLGIKQGFGISTQQETGSTVRQGFGFTSQQGKGTAVQNGFGTTLEQGRGSGVVFRHDTGFNRGTGQGFGTGSGQYDQSGSQSVLSQGGGYIVQGSGNRLSQQGGGRVTESQGAGVTYQTGQQFIAERGQALIEGKGEAVKKGEGKITVQGEGQIVSQETGQIIKQGDGQYTTQELVTQGQGQIIKQGGGSIVTQGQGQVTKQGGGAIVTQEIGQIVTQGGRYIKQGQGQYVTQGKGQTLEQGFGIGVNEGQGFLVSQGGGIGFGNEYSASTQRVFLQKYSGAGECGLLNPQTPYGSHNDLEVDFAEIPWQAMVLLQTNRSLLCGGVITRPDVVVTSASCVEGLDARNVLIKGGEWKLGIDDEPLPFQIVQVKTIIRHPEYRRGSLKYDAAILVLSENLRFAKNIQPICLPSKEDTLDAFYSGAGQCIVTGWGKIVLQAHLSGSIMHSVNVSLINPGECQAKLSLDYPHLLEQYDEDSCVCGQPTNPLNNICKVDIGSALACTTGDSRFVLQGVYSWDSGCQIGNQIAGFYKFDVEWYEWAIGLIESVRFSKYIIGNKVTQTKITNTQVSSVKANQFSSGVQGIKGLGVGGGVGISDSSQFFGQFPQEESGSKQLDQFLQGQFSTSGVQTKNQGETQFNQFGTSKFTELKSGEGALNFGTQIKGPISKTFTTTYKETKVFQSEPKYVTYTTKPEIVTFTTKPEYYTFTTKPKIVTYTTKPKIITYTTKPEIVTYTTKPEIVTYTTKPEIVTYTTKPEYFTYTTKPKIVSYTTKPQLIKYETSGSGINPQYVAPGVTYNPSFSDVIGKHKHNSQCQCLEGNL